MVPAARAKDVSRAIQMTPNELAMAAASRGAIAQAWLNAYAKQVSWDDLKIWLRECPRL